MAEISSSRFGRLGRPKKAVASPAIPAWRQRRSRQERHPTRLSENASVSQSCSQVSRVPHPLEHQPRKDLNSWPDFSFRVCGKPRLSHTSIRERLEDLANYIIRSWILHPENGRALQPNPKASRNQPTCRHSWVMTETIIEERTATRATSVGRSSRKIKKGFVRMRYGLAAMNRYL